MSPISSKRGSADVDVRALSTGRWWAVGVLALVAAIGGLDNTVVVTALPTLSEKLHASTDELQWVVDAYTLVLSGLLLVFGALGDRFGRRRVLLAGLVVFGVSSVIASQMTSAGGLIAMRAVMGAGMAPIVVLTYSVLPSMFPSEERAERLRAIAILSAITFVGLALGPLVGGFLLNRFAWGSIFLINAPIVGIALVGVWRFVPETKDPRSAGLDWLGAALSVAGVSALVYGVIEQPMYGWASPRVLAGVIAGVALLAVFAAQQLRGRLRLADLKLFAEPLFGVSTLAIAIVMFALGGVFFMLPVFLQIVQGNDAQATGMRMLPLMGGLIAGAGLANGLTAKAGYKVMVAAGLVVSAAGAVLLSLIGADTGFGSIAAAEVVIGLGMGLVLPTAGDAVVGELPETESGSGFALTRTAQFVALALGVAVLGSILNATYRSGLSGHLAGLPAPAIAAAKQNIAATHGLAPHVSAAAHTAYANGIGDVMLISAGILVAAAALAVLFLPARAARQPEQDAATTAMPTASVARPVKPPRDKRPASRATRPCPGRAREPGLVPPPPECCPTSNDSAQRDLIERRARIEIDVAEVASDRRAVARAAVEREQELLAADIALSERRARALECGIECLEDDIENTRALVARRPPPLWGPG